MKITITGDAYVIASDIKAKDIELLKKYDPDALKVKDKDGNDKFTIAFAEGKPGIQKFAGSASVTFGGKTRDEAGNATITGTLPVGLIGKDEAKEHVAELITPFLPYLNQLEKSIPETAKKIRDERSALLEKITVS